MRVLYRVPYPYFFSQHESVGGHVAHSLGIVGGLIDNGHEVMVLAHEGKGKFENTGAQFERVRGNGSGRLWRQNWLRRFFRRSRQLLPHHSFDFTYTRYSASATPQLWWTFSRESTPGVLEINSLGSQRMSWLQGLDARVIQAASIPIVVSHALRTWIRQNLGPDVSSAVRVVRNGVGDARFRTVPESHQEGTFRCAYAGLIKPDYGLECLVEVAKLLPEDEFSFHIFGAGPFKSELRNYASAVRNVVLEGEIPFEDVPDRLHEIDCLVHTTSSKWSFQSPTKLFEYMAIGRPIVAARTPPTKRILKNGKFGQLFALGSPSSLRDTILEVRRNYSLALDRARAAQQEARHHHRWVHRAKSIVNDARLVVDEES